ncbi:MAG: hypothetical protein AABX89_03480 [Candidatus Thermoplasmatota archaeon]
MVTWNRVCAIAALAWGVTVAGAGLVHTIASANTAITERGGLDNRFALMFAVGSTLLLAGAVLAGTTHWLWQGRRFIVAIPAAGFILGYFLILRHAVGPAGIAIAAAVFLLLAVPARNRRAFVQAA